MADSKAAFDVSQAEAEKLAEQHSSRLQRLDALLPRAGRFAVGDSAGLLSARAGASRALACASYRSLAVGDPALMWGPAYRHELRVQLPDGDQGALVDSLLGAWSLRVAADRSGSHSDSGATLDWPSRDTQAVPALLHHGLVPLMVLAARPAGTGATPTPTPDITLRKATPADIDQVVALRLLALRYDMQFGFSPERPGAARYARGTAERDVAGEHPWTWLALDGDEPLGVVAVAPPQRAGWVAPMVRAGSSVGYVGVLSVVPAARGAGVGRALMAKAHAELDAAGVEVTVLHHRLLNPRSTPFWNSHGYRPLWTTWWAQPASTLR